MLAVHCQGKLLLGALVKNRPANVQAWSFDFRLQDPEVFKYFYVRKQVCGFEGTEVLGQ